MAESKPNLLTDEQVAALSEATGATPGEIRAIEEIVGSDRASIIREARIVVGQKPPSK